MLSPIQVNFMLSPNLEKFMLSPIQGNFMLSPSLGKFMLSPSLGKFMLSPILGNFMLRPSREFHAQSKPKECHARSNSREFHAQPKPRDFGGVGARKESSPEPIKICQLKSASQFSMNIQVGNRCVSAVVDSAAEVSLISDKVYRSLAKPPKKLQDVTLHTAGRQMVMKGFIVGPVQ